MTERTLYRIPTRIKALHENATPPIGWFVHFEGSWESLFLGPDKPEALAVGDVVFIDIVKSVPDQLLEAAATVPLPQGDPNAKVSQEAS